ncbi:MAG: DUF3043 domain-containing protein [Actinomycetota bacterium]|nr:DUF3043 domain-containing protein [Actinomycetota bacterium]
MILRRGRQPAPPPPDPAGTPSTDRGGVAGAGKGRPTPKRRDVQKRRGGPLPPPPANRREAYARTRASQRERRSTVKQAGRTGDERNLLPRDAGPVRRLVRDVVDARRNIATIFIPLAVVTLGATIIHNKQLQVVGAAMFYSAFLIMIVDSVLLMRTVRRTVAARFPEAPAQRGLAFYAISRSTVIRRLRMPKPQVRPGAKV